MVEPGVEETHLYCVDERVCALGLDPRSRDLPTQFGGLCVEESLCDSAQAAGLDFVCAWSDGTERVTGAPAISGCPPAPHAATPFCGEGCGACPDLLSTGLDRPEVCLGRSDERGLGVCALGDPNICGRGVRAGEDVCLIAPGIPIHELMDTTCVCAVFRDATTPDGLADVGWATSVEGCRAYRALYPGAIDCVINVEWDTLP